MKISIEEARFLLKVRDAVDRLIDRICEKYGFDRAYFNFVVYCDVLNESFKKIDEIVLIDDRQYGFCEFCGEKTYFSEDDVYYCASCYGKINSEKLKK